MASDSGADTLDLLLVQFDTAVMNENVEQAGILGFVKRTHNYYDLNYATHRQ